jgi:hypothetical protein
MNDLSTNISLRFIAGLTRRLAFATALAAALAFGSTAFAQTAAPQPAPAAQPAPSAPSAPPAIDPKVTAILKAACNALTSAKTLSFTAVDTYERAARNGQPLYYTNKSLVTLQRPDKLRVIKTGDGIPDEFYYDGKTMAAYVPSANLIAISDAPPTIDKMLDAAWDIGAIYFPFSDVIASNPCGVFDAMKSAFYVGQSVVVGGTTTDIVAVTGTGVQAELWIGAADHLPRMIRVSYPDEPAHAHYQTDYSDWKLSTPVDGNSFKSAKAASAKRIAFNPPGAVAPPRPKPAAEIPTPAAAPAAAPASPGETAPQPKQP